MTGSPPHNPFLEVVLAAVLAELAEHSATRGFIGTADITEMRRRDGYAFLALVLDSMRGALTDDMRTAIIRATPTGCDPDEVWNAALDAALGRRTAH